MQTQKMKMKALKRAILFVSIFATLLCIGNLNAQVRIKTTASKTGTTKARFGEGEIMFLLANLDPIVLL